MGGSSAMVWVALAVLPQRSVADQTRVIWPGQSPEEVSMNSTGRVPRSMAPTSGEVNARG